MSAPTPRPALDDPLTPDDLGRGTAESPQLVVEVWLRLRGPPRLLILRRSDVRGGFWQGVSGRVESQDETLRHAALREVREETGFTPNAAEILDLHQAYAFRGFVSGRAFRKRSLALLLPQDLTPDDVALSDEHVEARVVPFEEARGIVQFDSMQQELDALLALDA